VTGVHGQCHPNLLRHQQFGRSLQSTGQYVTGFMVSVTRIYCATNGLVGAF
jgi:hypothetical protein